MHKSHPVSSIGLSTQWLPFRRSLQANRKRWEILHTGVLSPHLLCIKLSAQMWHSWLEKILGVEHGIQHHFI